MITGVSQVWVRCVCGVCVCVVCVYQEQQCVVDDELSGECEQILAQGVKQRRDENQSEILSGHLVHLREHLDPEETHKHHLCVLLCVILV